MLFMTRRLASPALLAWIARAGDDLLTPLMVRVLGRGRAISVCRDEGFGARPSEPTSSEVREISALLAAHAAEALNFPADLT